MTGYLAGMGLLVVLLVIVYSRDRGTHLSALAARRAAAKRRAQDSSAR